MRVIDFSRNEFGAPAPILGDRLYGIEIEVEDAADRLLQTVNIVWGFIGDGSLRNNGLEIRSQPILKSALEQQIHVAYGWLNNNTWTSGIRTSTHVHVDVRPQTLEQIKGVATVYSVLEPVLFALCGRVREENIYCVPWYRAEGEIDVVKRVVGGSWQSVQNCCKYSALYMKPMLSFGTLEFRQAPVFSHAIELINWIKIIEKIVDYGIEADPRTFLSEYYEHGPLYMIDKVFGNVQDLLLGHVADVEELIENTDSLTLAEVLVQPESGQLGWDLLASGVTSGTLPLGYHSDIMQTQPRPPPPIEFDANGDRIREEPSYLSNLEEGPFFDAPDDGDPDEYSDAVDDYEDEEGEEEY